MKRNPKKQLIMTYLQAPSVVSILLTHSSSVLKISCPRQAKSTSFEVPEDEDNDEWM